MLTETFYVTLARRLRQSVQRPLFVAVGTGEQNWDLEPPSPARATSALVNETARLAVERVVFLDGEGQPSQRATQRLNFRVVFGRDDANGTLRECGLFGDRATETPGSGALLSYFVFPRIEKTANMELERTITIDLTPRVVEPPPIEPPPIEPPPIEPPPIDPGPRRRPIP